MDNIEEIVKAGLCTGCGTCAGVCPNDSIEMKISNGLILPTVEKAACNSCRLCVKCCPGHSVDFRKLNSEIFGRQPEDPMMGNLVKCYLGHSNEEEIRFNSSSGGVVTHLLTYALGKGLIDGALVVMMERDNPLKPEPFVARTKEDVISASKSKYCPVAANVALREILSKEGKYAVVGLPCHIHGIRKAESNIPKLKNRIVLHIGLFCGHTVNFTGTELLLRKSCIDQRNVARLDYRGKGWPGYMAIQLKEDAGSSLQIRFNRGWNAYWNVFSPFFFTPTRCLVCPDQFNELSDVSAGDAWLPELRSDRAGTSVLIARAPVAEKLLASAKKSTALSLKTISRTKVRDSQSFSLKFKKEGLSGHTSLLRKLGIAIPRMNPVFNASGFLATIAGLLLYISYKVSTSKSLTPALQYVPLPLFRLYFGLFRSVATLSKISKRS